MKVIKSETQFGLSILFREYDRELSFTFCGNGDLYWSINTKNGGDKKTFVITKENYYAYMLFEKLFDDIKNINIFDEKDSLFDINFFEEKNKYKLHNYANYNELYDFDNKIITWYSDETAHEVANILKIKKDDDKFILNFYIQPHRYGYDRDFHSNNYIPIRFRNSGSRYAPFNVVFMRMYRNMNELDDINDIGHQIHIEEYLYSKVRTLIKNK